MSDPRSSGQIQEDHERANEFAQKGTLEHFLLRNGFMPHDEKDAEAILLSIIEENEELRRKVQRP